MLAQRRFWRRTEPFPHLYATDVFTPEFHEALTAQFREILGRGFGAPGEPGRFTRNMPHSDAYGYDLPPEQDGPLGLLYSRALLDLLARMLGVAVTADVNAALHHHQLGSKDGMIHNDVGIGYFSEQPRSDGVNPMDLRRCGYTDGHLANGATRCHQVVRAVTMIYYLANPPWRPGDGGETGLYRAADADLHRPAAAIPPINNSLVLFENTPAAHHSFLKNHHERNSAILWLHRPRADAVARFGERAIFKW